MFFWFEYENGITGLVTVQIDSKPFNFLKELIENGYKVPSENDMQYEETFQLPIQALQYSTLSVDKSKLVWKYTTQRSDMNLKVLNAYYKHFFISNMQCYHTKYPVGTIPRFLFTNMPNQYWMMKSVQRLYQGGFVLKWIDRSKYAQANVQKVTYIEPIIERMPDLITIKRILSLVVVCCVINSFAVIVLIAECILSSK